MRLQYEYHLCHLKLIETISSIPRYKDISDAENIEEMIEEYKKRRNMHLVRCVPYDAESTGDGNRRR